MGTVGQDLRYSIRLLLRSPGFAAIAIAALAVGIGANTAIFTVVDSVLLRPLGFAAPEQLVMVWEHNRRLGNDRNSISPANYRDWRAQNTVFEKMSLIIDGTGSLTGAGEPEEISLQIVEPEFFPLLGVQPALGRVFSADDAEIRDYRTVVLSHSLWVRKFGADPSIVGRTITFDGRPNTVTGVMPSTFPSLGRKTEMWTAMKLDPARDYRKRAGRYARAIARIKPGVTREQAQAEMTVIASRLEKAYPEFNPNWGANVVTLRDQLVGGVQTSILIFQGAVGLVLLIACANVANLLLARATSRRREIAIRYSLGAAASRVARQLLTESLLLATAGGALGLLFAYWTIAALQLVAPRSLPRLNEINLDWRVFAFTAALTLVTGILFGLAPALSGSHIRLAETMRAGGASTASSRLLSLRGLFVAAQVAFSLVLLTGAGLLVRSFVKLQAVDPGFQPAHVLTANVSLPSAGYEDAGKRVAFFKDAVDRVQHLPGVTSASSITFLPFAGMGAGTDYLVVGRPKPSPAEAAGADIRIIHPDYFRTMGIPLRRGRAFNQDDYRDQAPRTFVVSESLVRQQFPNQDAIGQRLVVDMGDATPGVIVGIVGDIKHSGLDSKAYPTIYYSHPQLPFAFMTFVVRTAGEPMSIAPALQAVVHQMNPQLPVSDVESMDDLIARSVSQPRFQTLLLGFFAAAALLLAAIGIYGVMSYAVAQRTSEIGLRMALGADASGVMAMVLRQGMQVVSLGLVIGVAASLMMARLLKTLLFEVEPTDTLTFVAVASAMSLVALMACFVPARRAMRVDPLVALRWE
ncbi:MAG: ABC transporter permease [Bryobacteraceae bacterium]